MEYLEFSIIIPAYDAAHCLGGCLETVRRFLEEGGSPYEIIVVDDGSKDRTPDIIREYERKVPQVRGVAHGRNRGKGAAVRTGMLAARGRLRLATDADNATDISYLTAALRQIQDGADVAIASRSARDVPGAGQAIPQGVVRRLAGIFGNALIRLAGLHGIHDTQCGFKLFRAEAAERLFSLSRIDRWAFDIEILLLARRMGFRVGIFPVQWKHNPVSSVTPASYLVTLRDLARIRWNLWRGAYR